VTFQTFPDNASAVQALRSGAVDAVDPVAPSQVANVVAAPDLALTVYDTNNFSFYAYNLDPDKTPLFQQREVRQALLLALDREAMLEAFYSGLGEIGVGTQSLLSPAYAPDRITTRYPFDPDRARALLAAAGWVDADGDGVRERAGTRLAFRVSYPAGTPVTDQIVAYLQEAWAAVGAAMMPDPIPFDELVDIVTESRDFEIVYFGFAWDPSGNQGAMFACAEYDGGFNLMRYCNPRYDELDERQLRELDPATRRELQIALANIVNDDLPIGILRFAQHAAGASTRVHNFHPNGYGT